MPVKAIVDLKVIAKNALAVKRKLPEKTLFCAVVKADAYGHGAEEVSNALYKTADYFAVATVEEGVRLRQAGIDKNILVLTKTFFAEAKTAAAYSLMLTVGDLKDLRVYSRAAKAAGEKINVHIKYDTGMSRQGLLSLSELETAMSFCKKSKFVKAAGLYTHYAMPEDEKSLNAASDKFSFAIKVAKRYNKDIICHASASGGFLCGRYYDMVRIGILLYGYKPFKSDAVAVKPAMKILAPIITKRRLNGGDCALYGEKRAEKQTEFMLIRYGYADGLLRKEIAGQFNNRCMDLTAAISPKTNGKYAVVMENAEILAESYGTISYEILVKCALRAEKIYLR